MSDYVNLMRQANSRQLAQLKKWQKAWDNLAKTQSSSSPDATISRKCVNDLTGWDDSFPQFKSEWKELESQISEQYKELTRGYETALRQACKQKGYHVDGESPNLTVDGLIKVMLDKEKNRASVNGKRAKALALPAVMQRIDAEQERIWKRKFDPMQFLGELQSAYDAVCQDKVVSRGEYLSLQDIHQKLRGKNRKYAIDLFSADLSRLREVRVSQSESRGLEFAPVRDPRKAIYVYDRISQSGRYIGLVRFTKEQ